MNIKRWFVKEFPYRHERPDNEPVDTQGSQSKAPRRHVRQVLGGLGCDRQ